MMLLRPASLIVLAVSVLASGCTEFLVGSHILKKGSASNSCMEEGALKVGNPYLVDGVRYIPQNTSYNYREKGIASWYGDDFHGKATANGECYNMYAFTAAHKTLPLPTIVRVTNLENNRSIVLKVNDRGPFVPGRMIDLSYAAAQSLDMVRFGTAPVLVEAMGGPHHDPDGARGYARRHPENIQLGPRDVRAATLPTVVPQTEMEEDLPPLMAANKAGPAPVTPAFRKVPPPATNLPPAPERASTPFSSAMPLQNSRVYVQVGAFSEKPRAEATLKKLAAILPDVELAPLNSTGGATFWRVRSKAFNSVAEAESALTDVQRSFPGAQIKVEE